MPDSRGKFTLDELLRAKRNEQPEPEFWAQFDREFRAKQKLLIQKQLVRETRLKSPSAAKLYRFGAAGATFGLAAFAVYLGFQAPVGDSNRETQSVAQAQSPAKPSFSVAATASQQPATQSIQSAGLQEFATLAQPSSPRIRVKTSPTVARVTPTPTQLSMLETLAELEQTIRPNRASNKAKPVSHAPSYQFVSSSGLFETEIAEFSEQAIEDVWDIEDAYLLGKYADPITGTLNAAAGSPSLRDIQHTNISQLDRALSAQSSRRSQSSLDALSVSF